MLKQLCEIPSPASGEENIKKYLSEELRSYTDRVYTDSFGNLIFEKLADGKISGETDKKSVVIECGTDEPFIMATDGEADKIRFSAPPHINAAMFADKLVVNSEGASLKILSEAKVKAEDKIKLSDLYAEKKGEGRKTGELFTLLPNYYSSSDSVVSENLMYKIPPYIVSEVIKGLDSSENDLYFLFSVNKCLAARGIKAFLSENCPDFLLSVGCVKKNDALISGNSINSIICAKEKSCVPTVGMRKNLCKIAERNGIEYSTEILNENLNLRQVLTTGRGTECGFVGVSCNENDAGGYETLKKALKNVINLIISYCKEEKNHI